MAIIEQHKNGEFCWFELGTSDQAAAKTFYTGLFGWSFNDFPMGPEGVYTIFKLQDRDAAACYTPHPEHHKGVPPHWAVYVQVESADAAAAKTTESGGKAVVPPFDVFDLGRMAVLQDPTGAVFQVWQPKKNKGTGITGVNGTVCWGELRTNNTAMATAFYTGLFGWKTKDSTPPGEYTEWLNSGQPIGGMMTIQAEWGPVPPHWAIYFQVDDIDATIAKAKASGAKVEIPATPIPNTGTFAGLSDPQGAHFLVIQLGKM